LLRLSVMQWILIQVSSAVISAEQDGENLCRRLEHMKGHRIFPLVAAIFFLACACVSCESGSSSSDPGEVLPPRPWDNPMPDPSDDTTSSSMELIGSWVGYFLAGDDDVFDDVFNYSNENDNPLEFDFDDDDLFAIGIITREKEARFIGDTSQFVCPEGSLGASNIAGIRTIFGGYFDYYTWNTQGLEPYTANVEPISIYGNALFSIYFLDGFYWYTDTPEADRDFWQFQFFNYTTTGISADIEKIAGQWKISDAFWKGNTLTFTIEPNEDRRSATITGTDTHTPQNTFEGTIIEIHYDDTDLYDVSLKLNEEFDLEGLATYVSSYDNQGIHAESSLAIGVSDGQRMVTGLAAPVPEE